MLNPISLSIIMLSIIMVSVVMMSFIRFSVIMLSDVAPLFDGLQCTCHSTLGLLKYLYYTAFYSCK
jgi:hypothetical protein